jgi:molybdate transport repressor ModE-like protein
MKVEHLRRVLEINKTGSINRAAQNLYISQSTLSSSVNALEAELGEKIFQRTQEGVTLTGFGGQFIQHADEILKHFDQIERLCAYGVQPTPPRRLDVMVYYLFFASQVWAEFCNSHKNGNIDLNFFERTRSEIITAVAEGKAELGLVMMPSVDREKWLAFLSDLGVDYTIISVEPPHAVVGPNCDFYEEAILTPAQMAQRRMIIFPEENPLFSTIDRIIFRKYSPSSYLTVCERGSLMGILQRTGGYYLGTYNRKAYSKYPFYDQVRRIPILGADYHYEIGYVTRRGNSLSKLAGEYLQMVRNVMV